MRIDKMKVKTTLLSTRASGHTHKDTWWHPAGRQICHSLFMCLYCNKCASI